MLIQEAVEETMNYIRSRGLAQATIEWYAMGLRLFSRYLTDHNINTIEDVTTQRIQEYLTYVQVRDRFDGKPGKLSVSTVNTHIKTLRGQFKCLYLNKRIPENPAENIKYLRKTHRIINAFTSEQLKRLISVIPADTFTGQRNRLLILILVDCGLRISEALSIRTGDIYFDNQLIKIFGKGSKERLVPFGQRIKKQLADWILIHQLSDDEKIFFSFRGDSLTGAAFRAQLRQYGRQAGIKGVEVRPHVFRHTFAVMFLRNGGNPFVLQRILGHTTLDMTQRYVNLLVEDLQREHEKFGPGDRLGFDF